MGIPTYFRQITEKYSNVIIDFKNKFDEKVDFSKENIIPTHIFLDFNCLIHPCVQNVLNLYQNKDQISKNDLENLFLKEIQRYLFYILDEIKPTKLIYIAIDGVAPRAKMVQQRKRRFRSVKEKKEIKKIKKKLKIVNNNNWDKNAITPGTQFMKKLSQFLIKIIETNFRFDKIHVILSDSSVHGEGEHKILQYLRDGQQTNLFDTNDNFIIYGLDADLIMLSMASKLDNIYLLRESVHFGKIDTESLLYLDINKLKSFLFDELSSNTNIELDKNMIINDYILICFLIGNDFIPKLPSLNIKNNAIDLLISLYIAILNERMEYLVYSGDINMGFLKEIFKKISIIEDQLVTENRKKYYAKKYYEKNTNDELSRKINEIKFMPLINKNKDLVIAGTENWRERYYYILFNLKNYSVSKNIEEICLNYLEGIYWTTKYYFCKCESWRWYYKYMYSPSCKELVEYFDICFDKLKFNKDEPVTPFVQLINVLPPQSSHLLPKEYSDLMISFDSPIIHYYPEYIKLDKYHHIYYHECEPKLPNINLELVLKTIDKIKINYDLNKNGDVWNNI